MIKANKSHFEFRLFVFISSRFWKDFFWLRFRFPSSGRSFFMESFVSFDDRLKLFLYCRHTLVMVSTMSERPRLNQYINLNIDFFFASSARSGNKQENKTENRFNLRLTFWGWHRTDENFKFHIYGIAVINRPSFSIKIPCYDFATD